MQSSKLYKGMTRRHEGIFFWILGQFRDSISKMKRVVREKNVLKANEAGDGEVEEASFENLASVGGGGCCCCWIVDEEGVSFDDERMHVEDVVGFCDDEHRLGPHDFDGIERRRTGIH